MTHTPPNPDESRSEHGPEKLPGGVRDEESGPKSKWRLAIVFLLLGPGLGLLLGPWGLGKFGPQTYDALFVGTGDQTKLRLAETRLEEYRTHQPSEAARQVAQLKATGVTETAVEELGEDLRRDFGKGMMERQKRLDEEAQAVAERKRLHAERMRSFSTVLMVVFGACTLVACLVPTQGPLRRRLGALGLFFLFPWLVLAFAQSPNPLAALGVFAGGIAAIGLVYLFWKAVLGLIDRMRPQ